MSAARVSYELPTYAPRLLDKDGGGEVLGRSAGREVTSSPGGPRTKCRGPTGGAVLESTL